MENGCLIPRLLALAPLPMTNADENALRAARPNVGVWLDKLRRAGHVVFVRQFQQGAKPNAGYRINVDGQTMTVWELWARFRSKLGDEEPNPAGHPHSA
jgi:hypothetical protein